MCMKTMFVGGPTDFGQVIIDRFSADSFSRRNGHDINDQSVRKELAKRSLDYDVVILHTWTIQNSQTLLLQDILRQWMDNNHNGQLIITGSSASHFVTYKPEPSHWVYTSQKTGLDSLCKMVSKKCTEGKFNFKITILKPGMLDSEKSRAKDYFIKGIPPNIYCDTIKFLLTLPKDIHIPELILETTYV